MSNEKTIFRVIGGITRPITIKEQINSRPDKSQTRPMKCPGCRKDVYFYKNEHGSEVFFDELGGNWPKHSCNKPRRKKNKNKNKLVKNNNLLNTQKKSKVNNPPPVQEDKEVKSRKNSRKKTIRYPLFDLEKYKKVFLVKNLNGIGSFAFFKQQSVHTDFLKRNGVPVLDGYFIKLTSEDRQKIKKYHMNMPIFLREQRNREAVLITHLIIDGEVQEFAFLVKLLEEVQKPVDQIIWTL